MNETIPLPLLKEIVPLWTGRNQNGVRMERRNVFLQIEWQIFYTHTLRMVAQIPGSSRSEDIDEFILVIRVASYTARNISQRYCRLLETSDFKMYVILPSFNWTAAVILVLSFKNAEPSTTEVKQIHESSLEIP